MWEGHFFVQSTGVNSHLPLGLSAQPDSKIFHIFSANKQTKQQSSDLVSCEDFDCNREERDFNCNRNERSTVIVTREDFRRSREVAVEKFDRVMWRCRIEDFCPIRSSSSSVPATNPETMTTATAKRGGSSSLLQWWHRIRSPAAPVEEPGGGDELARRRPLWWWWLLNHLGGRQLESGEG